MYYLTQDKDVIDLWMDDSEPCLIYHFVCFVERLKGAKPILPRDKKWPVSMDHIRYQIVSESKYKDELIEQASLLSL